MISVGLVTIGKVKEKFLLDAINHYLKMSKPYVSWQIFELKPEKFSDSNKVQALRLEQQRLSEFIKNTNQKNIWQPILLTETGTEFSSQQFSQWLTKLTKAPLFILGGSLGFDDDFKKEFKMQLSLSQLTTTHELARLIITEQIYRSATIINDKNYHN